MRVKLAGELMKYRSWGYSWRAHGESSESIRIYYVFYGVVKASGASRKMPVVFYQETCFEL